MKIKDMVKMPEPRKCSCKIECEGCEYGYNIAREEIGNMEISTMDFNECVRIADQYRTYDGEIKAYDAIFAICQKFAKPVKDHQYQCKCCHCGELFIGDKREVCCDGCAMKSALEMCQCKVPTIDHNDTNRIHGSKCSTCHKTINIFRDSIPPSVPKPPVKEELDQHTLGNLLNWMKHQKQDGAMKIWIEEVERILDGAKFAVTNKPAVIVPSVEEIKNVVIANNNTFVSDTDNGYIAQAIHNLLTGKGK